MEKIFSQKNVNNFVWSPLGCRGNIYINFCLQVHFQESAAWYCSHYLPPASMTPVANLPPVSLIPVVHLDLRISPQIFEKFRNDLNVIIRGLGEGDSCKKTWNKKSCETVPLNRRFTVTAVMITSLSFTFIEASFLVCSRRKSVV